MAEDFSSRFPKQAVPASLACFFGIFFLNRAARDFHFHPDGVSTSGIRSGRRRSSAFNGVYLLAMLRDCRGEKEIRFPASAGGDSSFAYFTGWGVEGGDKAEDRVEVKTNTFASSG